MSFSSGDTIMVQEVWKDRVWAARPMTVVRDEGDLLVLWFPRGTRWKMPTPPTTRPREGNRGTRLATCATSGDWVLRDAEWDVDTLSFTRAGDWHSVWVSWAPDGSDWGWYVNLQRPFERTPIGIETMDMVLDVLIAPDRSWRWKDEDELEAFVARGAFDHRLASKIREEGLRVVESAKHDEPPFSEPWRQQLRPDPAWRRPELVDGWDRLCR